MAKEPFGILMFLYTLWNVGTGYCNDTTWDLNRILSKSKIVINKRIGRTEIYGKCESRTSNILEHLNVGAGITRTNGVLSGLWMFRKEDVSV